MTAFPGRPHGVRATGPARPSIRILDGATLSAQGAAWDDLLARAVAPHPHFSRHVIEAHRDAGLLPDRLVFVTVWTGDRLDALLPCRRGFDVTGLGRVVAQPCLSPFMTSSAPLVAREAVAPTLATLVAGLAQASGGRAWRWPLLSVETRIGRGLREAMVEAGWITATIAAFERPVLDRRADHDAFLDGHPHKGRLKDLRRRRRRLSEGGVLELATATEGDALAAAVEAFLDLEAAGWKGEGGTAMRCGKRTLALARALFAPRPGSIAGPVQVRADSLSLAGRPLAVSLALVAGGTACLLKTAYDEGERAHAPGLLLEAEIVRALHETGFADRLDSATLAGSALESLYRERETVAEIVAVPPGGLVAIERRVALARLEHRARAEAKRLLHRR